MRIQQFQLLFHLFKLFRIHSGLELLVHEVLRVLCPWKLRLALQKCFRLLELFLSESNQFIEAHLWTSLETFILLKLLLSNHLFTLVVAIFAIFLHLIFYKCIWRRLVDILEQLRLIDAKRCLGLIHNFLGFARKVD